jgi:hypothetical protein
MIVVGLKMKQPSTTKHFQKIVIKSDVEQLLDQRLIIQDRSGQLIEWVIGRLKSLDPLFEENRG